MIDIKVLQKAKDMAEEIVTEVKKEQKNALAGRAAFVLGYALDFITDLDTRISKIEDHLGIRRE